MMPELFVAPAPSRGRTPQDGTVRRTAYEDLGPAVQPLVNGEPCGGTGAILLCVNPASGEPFARVACAGPAEIEQAIESASAASSLWRGAPVGERCRRITRLADLVLQQADAIAGLIALEQGKPVHEALVMEVLPALDHLRYLAAQAEGFCSGEGIDPRHPFYAHKRAHFLYDPLGVVALITPFNLPFALPIVQVASALVMGNAVILKPSEEAALTGLRIGELCVESGIPAGIVNVLPATREDVLRLVSHPKIAKVFFTGSPEAGRLVMATAGCAPRPVVLSLAGKHPSIVTLDADLDRAARGIAWGALANCGQNCGAIERVYVDERVAAPFVEKLLAEVDRVRVGDPLLDGTDMGPLVSEARRAAVHEQVVEAVAAGGRLLRGGEIPPGPGFFYPPTVVQGPPEDCRLMREETLGPVISIVAVESLEQALLRANESPYALTASGWTTDAKTAERLMLGLQAGVVTINDVLYSFGEPAATWSGYKASGLGHTHGGEGLREFCRQRFVSADEIPSSGPLHGFPYDAAASKMAAATLAAFHAPGRLRRLRGVLSLMRQKRFRSRLPVRSFLLAFKRRTG